MNSRHGQVYVFFFIHRDFLQLSQFKFSFSFSFSLPLSFQYCFTYIRFAYETVSLSICEINFTIIQQSLAVVLLI